MATRRMDDDDLVEVDRPKCPRRSHRKSRLGCFHCKRRKVKCDEIKPTCSNCVRFGIGCEYPKDRPTHEIIQESTSIDNYPIEEFLSTPIPRRGRGRPRKNWTIPVVPTSRGSATPPTSSSSPSSSLSSALTSLPASPVEGFQSLNIAGAELLLQFISSTVQSLTRANGSGDPMWRFWAYEVPRMGFSNEFLLHLVLAIAGHHLARTRVGDARASNYAVLAQRHFQAGLAGFREALPNFSKSNGVALYISAMLVCWCTFAAGPTGPGDLLVCDVSSEGDVYWMPLVHGVRIIRTAIESSDFSSSLEVPGKQNSESPPPYVNEHPALDWEQPLQDLHDRIVSSGSPHVTVYLHAFHDMQGIFEEIFGKSDGSRSNSPISRFIFGWLYRMEDPFVGCLRAAEPLALLTLAYYAVLLGIMNDCWYLEGWAQHLVMRVDELLGPDYKALLQWPKDQVVHSSLDLSSMKT